MLQVRKVMEHVYEKIINLDNESQTTSSSNNEKPEQEKEEDIAVLAEEKIELLCQDQVSGLKSIASSPGRGGHSHMLSLKLATSKCLLSKALKSSVSLGKVFQHAQSSSSPEGGAEEENTGLLMLIAGLGWVNQARSS